MITDYRKTVETYERNIKELEQDLQESKTESGESDKYEVLHKKDKEMTQYMDEFPETKERELAQIEELESRIPAILDHMSSQISRQSHMPSKADVKDKKDSVAYNEGLNETAEETIVRIRMELETRQNDLEKIKSLEVKIEKENGSMNEKLENMEDEMTNTFP